MGCGEFFLVVFFATGRSFSVQAIGVIAGLSLLVEHGWGIGGGIHWDIGLRHALVQTEEWN